MAAATFCLALILAPYDAAVTADSDERAGGSAADNDTITAAAAGGAQPQQQPGQIERQRQQRQQLMQQQMQDLLLEGGSPAAAGSRHAREGEAVISARLHSKVQAARQRYKSPSFCSLFPLCVDASS